MPGSIFPSVLEAAQEAVTTKLAEPDPIVWPQLSTGNLVAMVAVNVGSLIFCIILLRCIWAPPDKTQVQNEKEMYQKIEAIQESYGSIKAATFHESGDVSGDYSAPWTTTFDAFLLGFMFVTFIILAIWTSFSYPTLWQQPMFWIMQLPKLAIMMLVAVLGGLTCRYFCEADESGYMVTTKHSIFKVNYTRKFQHFAAYLVPLVIKYDSGVTGPIIDAWGDWFTLLAFLLLIKPVRERIPFFMIQFNSLDRPEDRPNTLKWIIAGNIWPGLFMIIFWRWVFSYTNQESLAYIFVFITGLGDGLAEPVGIWMGKHKYWTKSLMGDRKYQRSLEGSSCVFIGSILFVTCWWYAFDNALQFWVAMILLPPMMTYAEAVSPHTMDTPFLMGLGGFVLWACSNITLEWTHPGAY